MSRQTLGAGTIANTQDEEITDRVLAREGLKRVSRVIVFALVMDAIYQYLVLRWFYPVEALVTAFVLAVLPYIVIRGPAARLARRWHRRDVAQDKAQ